MTVLDTRHSTSTVPNYWEAGLPALEPLGGSPAEPDGPVRALLAEGARLAQTPFGVAVLRYEDVSRLLRDPRLRGPGDDILTMQGITDGRLFRRNQEILLFMDGEDHRRLRRLVSKAFTPKAVDRLGPVMRDTFAEQLGQVVPHGRCEAVADLCESYPIHIICALVGVPSNDWPLFSRWADIILQSLSLDVASKLGTIEQAIEEIDEYVSGLIAERRRDPGEDLLSELIAVEEEGQRLTSSELLAVTNMMLVAGTDTTRNQLGLALFAFATHADQWKLLGERPELTAAAVEETIRFSAATGGLPRVTLEDIELHGVTIPAGTFVTLLSGVANHDPTILERPDELDITREVPAGFNLLTFGGGPHYCLGANLARAELQEALRLAAPALRDLALDGEPEWREPFGIWGPRRLPLRWST
ncbi:MAG TPA: cytochrome P450 [Acidimicrobiales bacterium]|nr:cytochrome P450 [Acidimicrobiales bacterium]